MNTIRWSSRAFTLLAAASLILLLTAGAAAWLLLGGSSRLAPLAGRASATPPASLADLATEYPQLAGILGDPQLDSVYKDFLQAYQDGGLPAAYALAGRRGMLNAAGEIRLTLQLTTTDSRALVAALQRYGIRVSAAHGSLVDIAVPQAVLEQLASAGDPAALFEDLSGLEQVQRIYLPRPNLPHLPQLTALVSPSPQPGAPATPTGLAVTAAPARSPSAGLAAQAWRWLWLPLTCLCLALTAALGLALLIISRRARPAARAAVPAPSGPARPTAVRPPQAPMPQAMRQPPAAPPPPAAPQAMRPTPAAPPPAAPQALRPTPDAPLPDAPPPAVKLPWPPAASSVPGGLRCPHCETRNRAEARFCTHCGRSLSPTHPTPRDQFCWNCGQPLRPTSHYCSRCGEPV
ncbi:MAG: zinc ribbon domain-containing protein [Chloroflexota bacterium]